MRVAWWNSKLAGGVREPCLVSLNPKTNRLQSHTGQRDNHSAEVNGTALTDEQRKRIANGESVLVENMWSEKKQRHYDARLQFNACKGGFDYDFKGIARRQEADRSSGTGTEPAAGAWAGNPRTAEGERPYRRTAGITGTGQGDLHQGHDRQTRGTCSVLSSVSTTSGRSSISSNGTRTRARNRNSRSRRPSVRTERSRQTPSAGTARYRKPIRKGYPSDHSHE